MGQLSIAKARFLKTLNAYDDRYAADEEEIILKFLNPLGDRTEAQSALLEEFTAEAKTHLYRFRGVRTNFTSRLVNQLGMFQIVGNGAQISLLSAGITLPPRDVEGNLTPLQKLQLLRHDLLAMHANLQAAGVVALDTVYRAEQLTCDLFDAGTALIVLRCATLRTFRQENLFSPLDKMRELLAEEAETEFSELVTDEVKEQLVTVLIEYGGQAGEIIVEELPGIGLLYKLARLFLKATDDPEKYSIVGGGDLMLALLSSLRMQNLLFENFEARLDRSFQDLKQAADSFN